MDNKLRQTGMDALALMGCALHGVPHRAQLQCSLTDLYTFCEFHSITAMIAMALEKKWKDEPPADAAAAAKFRQAQAQTMRKTILLNAEREQILNHLESIGCWYMPLKGSLLQFDYPKFGMRQMSDNDILIDASMQEQVHDFMCGRGYESTSYQTTVENNYHKAPVYNFEMHTALFGLESADAFGAYYGNVRERLIPVAGKKFRLQFTPEDFYIYMVAHGWKHALRSGIGLRFLADIWVWQHKYGNDADRAYLERELRKLGAADFEAQCRNLSEKLLDIPGEPEELTEPEELLLHQLFTAGTYGTMERKMENRMQQLEQGGFAKLRYALSRIFPSARVLSLTHPNIMNQKWKVPFIWLARLLRAVSTGLPATIGEIRMMLRKKK